MFSGFYVESIYCLMDVKDGPFPAQEYKKMWEEQLRKQAKNSARKFSAEKASHFMRTLSQYKLTDLEILALARERS